MSWIDEAMANEEALRLLTESLIGADEEGTKILQSAKYRLLMQIRWEHGLLPRGSALIQ